MTANLIGPQEPKHPEDLCDLCGRPNITWFAPSELWNKAIEGTSHDILCPVCFVQLAEDHGITPTAWMLAPEVLDNE